MKIKSKLFLGFGIVLCLLMITAGVAWNAMVDMSKTARQMQLAESSAGNVLQAQVAMLQYISTSLTQTSQTDEGKALAATVRENTLKAESALKTILPLAAEEQKKRIEESLAKLKDFQTAFQTIENESAVLEKNVLDMMDMQKSALENLNTIIERTEQNIREEYLERRLTTLILLNKAKEKLFLGRIAVRLFMANPNDQSAETALDTMAQAHEELQKTADFIIRPEVKVMQQNALASLEHYIESAGAYIASQKRLTLAESTAKASIDTCVNVVIEMTGAATARFIEIERVSVNTLIGLSLLGVLFGLFISVIIIRSITKPIKEALYFSASVAAGNFSIRWQTNSKDEMGQLAGALNEAFNKVAEKVYWFEEVLDSVPYGVSVTDLDMKWTFANKKALEAMGKKSVGEIEGHHCSEKNGDICNTPNCGIMQLRQGNPNVRFTNPRGQTFHIELTYLKDMTGQDIGHVEISRDISLEEKLRREAEEAIIKGRMETVNSLEGIVAHISKASVTLAEQISQSDQGSAQVAERMASTATAMEEMNATVLEVARNAGSTSDSAREMHHQAMENATIVGNVVNKMKHLHTTASGLKRDMAVLEEQAENIGQIMTVIADIADQTNLLALNAAIEAARAGEAGRGFAVVADEVRKLAEKTQHATAEVGGAIRQIQEASRKNMENVDSAVSAINETNELAVESGNALETILRMAEEDADKVRAIATAAEEQSATSEEINRVIGEVSRISNSLSDSMTNAAEAVESLAQQAAQLRQVMDNLKDTTQILKKI